MDKIIKKIHQLTNVTAVFGAVFLVGIMALTIISIVGRLFGTIVFGVYELTELSMVVTAGFAISYTTLNGAHVVLWAIASRISKTAEKVADCFNLIVGAVLYGGIAWITIKYIYERGPSGEGITTVEKIPIFPFKCVWAFALVLLVAIFLINLYSTITKGEKK